MAAHDLRPESTWSLKEVDIPGVSNFFVSSVHHDWILAAEMDLVRFAVSATEKCELAFDVGMNDGFYSQLFAAQGCEVHSFEIQQRCIEVSCIVAAENDFGNKIKIYESPVTAKHGDVVEIPVGNTTAGSCDGGFSFHTANSETKGHLPFKRIGERFLFGITLDEIFKHNTRAISFMKVDTEGHEFQVLEGARGLFQRRQVRAAVFEANPTFWREEDDVRVRVLDEIIDFGYYLKCSRTDFRLKQASDIHSRPADCGVDVFIIQDESFQGSNNSHKQKSPQQSFHAQQMPQLSGQVPVIIFFIAILIAAVFPPKFK